MAELREVAAILDSGKIEEEELQSALQALLFHQCLYEDWPHVHAYRIIARHLSHVQPIMAAFGYRLSHHPVAHMLILEPQGVVYGVQMARLKKDETIVLLVLRLLYAEGLSALDEQGRVESTTNDVFDRILAVGEEPPPLKRLTEILKLFQRKGLARLGEDDPVEQVTILTIMPAISVLVPDVYVESVVQWLEQRSDASADANNDNSPAPGLLAHVVDHRAQLGAGTQATLNGEAEDESDVPA